MLKNRVDGRFCGGARLRTYTSNAEMCDWGRKGKWVISLRRMLEAEYRSREVLVSHGQYFYTNSGI